GEAPGRAGHLLALALHPCGAPATHLLHFLRQAIDVLARERRAARYDDAAKALVLPFQLLAHFLADDLPVGLVTAAEVLNVEIVTQVGLVCPVALHRVAPGQPRERPLDPVPCLVPE